MAPTAAKLPVASESKMPKPANPVIEDIQEQREAPQLCERPVSPKTAVEFLQIHVRSIMPQAGVGHIAVCQMGYGQRTKRGKGGRVAYT
jgi:hypothetical protein